MMPRALPSLICALWAGLLLGGSFIAAPAKFTVETLDLPELLAVGRAQFQALAWAELALAALLVLSLLLHRPPRWWLAAVPLVILAEQQLVLMPGLDARTVARIAGEAVEESGLHLFYVALEGGKLLGLLLAALIWSGRRGEPRPTDLRGGE